MPVKVRCSGCEKVLNAPDKARGKAIKCPNCENRIRVPAGGSAKKPARKKAKKKAADDDSMFDKLDLSQAEDTSVQICPNCAAELYEDDVECPDCGYNLDSGRVRKRTKKDAAVEKFYGTAWKDSWRFAKRHTRIVIRTVVYWLLFGTITGGFIWLGVMALFKWDKPPVAVFGLAMAIVTSFGINGWFWFLWTEVIKVTMDKKDEMGKVNFDFFLVVALGLKQTLWQMAVNAQLGVMIFAMPVVMAHMAMPVTWRAWAVVPMLRIFFKNFKACMFWWLSAFIANFAAMVVLGSISAIVFFFAGSVIVSFELDIGNVIDRVPGDKEAMSKLMLSFVIAGLIVLTIVEMVVITYAGLFMMRVNGLFAKTFAKDIELVTRIKEKKWVSKTALKEQRKEAKLAAKRAKEEAKRAEEEDDDDDLY